MADFTLLHGSLLNSSLWVTGTKEVRILWVTMMAMKDKDGVVNSSFLGLVDRSKLTKEECEQALGVLMSPDPDDTSGVDNGIRVKEVPGRGWFLVNHERYRYSPDYIKAKWRESKAQQRQKNSPKAKQTPKKGIPESNGDVAFYQHKPDPDVARMLREDLAAEQGSGVQG
jgi:hypothetical protein